MLRKDNLLSRYTMRFIKLLYIVVNVSLFSIGIIVAYRIQWEELSASMPNNQVIWMLTMLILLYTISLFCITRLYMAFRVGYLRNENMMYCQFLASFISLAVSYIMLIGITFEFQNPVPFILVFVEEVLFSVLWCVFASKLYYKITKPFRTILLYGNDNDYRRISEANKFSGNFNVEAEIKITNETSDEVISMLSDIEVVFLSGLEMSVQNKIVTYCIEKNIKCYLAPNIGSVILSGGKHNQAFSMPIIGVNRSSPSLEYLFIKRVFDVVVSLLGIIVTSPIMFFAAVLIKLYDRGPVLYKQVRLTKNGKTFHIYKFRSMKVDAEKDGVARLSTANDNRITPIGKIIRATRIDEFPQFFNILKGDMTIVGPRPERPEIAEQYLKVIPEFNLRLQVKAGLTGYAQVYGKYNTNPYDKLEMDLMYINKMSILTDLKIILYTVRIIFEKDSTSGVESGQTTALFEEKDEYIKKG